MLVLAFQHGWGEPFGLQQSAQIEGWIPIFLFAMLFGLSMDYEVFLLSRIREEWDRRHDNEHAIAYGLEHTGRIITAAAIIMIAAFSGFVAGSFVGLQEFGLGLSVGDPARRDGRARDPRAGDDEAARATGTGTCPSACAARCACARARPRPHRSCSDRLESRSGRQHAAHQRHGAGLRQRLVQVAALR